MQSKGLEISNGIVTGIGSCTDTELTITLPIADSAFDGCTQIEAVYFLDGCTWVGYQAFRNCTNLRKVYFGQTTMPAIVGDTFAETWNHSDFAIYVPNALLQDYCAVSDGFWHYNLVSAGKIYSIESQAT